MEIHRETYCKRIEQLQGIKKRLEEAFITAISKGELIRVKIDKNYCLPSEFQSQLKTCEQTLSECLTIVKRTQMKCVVIGRTSNGKSSLINALIRRSILPTGGGHVSSCFVQFERTDKQEKEKITARESGQSIEWEDLKDLASRKEDEILDVYIHTPEEDSILQDDFILLDCPGVDNKKSLDDGIDKFCWDADIFVLVLNAEGTLTSAEDQFIKKCHEKVITSQVIVAFTHWDLIRPGRANNMKMKLTRKVQPMLEKFNECSTQNFVFFVSSKSNEGIDELRGRLMKADPKTALKKLTMSVDKKLNEIEEQLNKYKQSMLLYCTNKRESKATKIEECKEKLAKVEKVSSDVETESSCLLETFENDLKARIDKEIGQMAEIVSAITLDGNIYSVVKAVENKNVIHEHIEKHFLKCVQEEGQKILYAFQKIAFMEEMKYTLELDEQHLLKHEKKTMVTAAQVVDGIIETGLTAASFVPVTWIVTIPIFIAYEFIAGGIGRLLKKRNLEKTKKKYTDFYQQEVRKKKEKTVGNAVLQLRLELKKRKRISLVNLEKLRKSYEEKLKVLEEKHTFWKDLVRMI